MDESQKSYRKDEKNQLINLNNRLAVYVEKVRSFESQNSYLQRQLSSFEENRDTEVERVKALFEDELKEARKLLDELSKENAHLKLECTSLTDKNKTQEMRIQDVTNINQKLEEENRKTNVLLSEKTSEYDIVAKENGRLCEELETTKRELVLTLEEAESLKESRNAEIIQRIDVENKLQSANEELEFKERLHKEEVTEIRQRNVYSKTEADHHTAYENQLEAVLADLREQQSVDLESMKADLEEHYVKKVGDLSKQLDAAFETATKAQESGKMFEVKADRLQNTIKSLQSEINGFQNKVRDLEGEVETERQLRVTAIQVVEKDRDEAMKTIAKMEMEYGELLDTKLKLDREISVYRKLLEEEEQRLNLTPSVNAEQAKKRRPRPVRKRKRTDLESAEDTSQSKKISLSSSSVSSTTIETALAPPKPPSSKQQNAEANKSCLIM